ncbi:TauD/TfdA family dioxygenase [Actinomadura keratinilytica]|uniref:TauD/TfdA-like domain-containing protein n=1 Tax=Actinomadura keratinilytica TaxID=547461 RepID=A0ABP7YT73_9ACTN
MAAERADAVLRWPQDLGHSTVQDDASFDDRALLAPDGARSVAAAHGLPLDAIDALAAQIRARLRRPPYYTVVRGVGFGSGALLFGVLAGRIGRLAHPYPDPSYTATRILRPRESARMQGWGVLTEWLHTDSANWPAPNDVTMLQCVEPDQSGGGVSLLLSLDDALEEIKDRLGIAAVDRLSGEVLPWAIDDGLGGGELRAVPLTQEGLRWQPFRVATAVERYGSALPHRDTMEFIRMVDTVMLSSARLHRFFLRKDDLLVVNNRRALHARDAVPDPARSRRRVRHCKVDLTGPPAEGGGPARARAADGD